MKGYSFGELVKLAESMAPLSGAVFTGNVTAPKFLISTAQPSEANAATRRDWVAAELAKKLNLAGGSMDGQLVGKTVGVPNRLDQLDGTHAAFKVAPILVDPAAQGGVSYAEALHASSVVESVGYIQHLSLGTKRRSDANYHDVYLATGGTDYGATVEWLFGHAGTLTCPGAVLLGGATQAPQANAAVRRDYLINQLGNYLPLSGGRITGNLNISVGYLQLERAELPAVEFHAPGKHAHLVYLNVENGALEFSPSNGSGVGTTKAFAITTAEVTSQGRMISQANSNRGWNNRAKCNFYASDQTVGDGVLLGYLSGAAHFPGQHTLEYGYGSLTSVDPEKGANVLWATDGGSFVRTWAFYNNGKILTPSGTYLSPDGNIVGSAWDGGTLSAWVTNNFVSRVHNAGAIGSYAMCALINPPDAYTDQLRSGGELRYSAAGGALGSAPGGTWRCMGVALPGSGHTYEKVTLWLRVA